MWFKEYRDRVYYGWVVVAAFCVAGTAIWGIRFSFGVFFKSIEDAFTLSRAATSAIFSVHMVLGGVFTILGGWTLDRFGPRIVLLLMGICTGLSLLLTGRINALWQIFFTYSLLLAAGSSPIFVTVMSTVSRWFEKRRGIALGIASIGAGMGPLVLAPFAAYLISAFDWRAAFTVLGILAAAIVIPVSRLLKRDSQAIGRAADVGNGAAGAGSNLSPGAPADYLSPGQALRTRSFWVMLCIFFLYAINSFLVLTHIVPHVTDLGFSAEEGAGVLGAAGAATIAGRVLLGAVSDLLGRKRAFILCMLLQVGAMLWLLRADEMWMFYLFALPFGLARGGTGPVTAGIIGDAFGLGRMGAILGMLDTGFNTGAAVGPVIGGVIFDLTESYALSFLLGALVMLVAAGLITFMRRETGRSGAGTG